MATKESFDAKYTFGSVEGDYGNYTIASVCGNTLFCGQTTLVRTVYSTSPYFKEYEND